MLISLRQAGVGFEDIAEEMYAKLGVKISPNVLVKRYQKTLDSFLLVSLCAFLNASCLSTYLPNCYRGDVMVN